MSNSEPGVAAQLDLELRGPAGPAEPYAVRVMVPTRWRDDWQCEVRITGPSDRVRHICGVDSWQALTLALDFVRVNLEGDLAGGRQLLRFGEPIAVDELFSRSLAV